ncbi:MAG: hypothetical protein ACE5Q6_15000 [Dehalococcoidia bacterium]
MITGTIKCSIMEEKLALQKDWGLVHNLDKEYRGISGYCGPVLQPSVEE